MNEAAEPVEVLLHVFGINQQLVDQARQAIKREIQRHRRIGRDHALGRGVRDIALMPQRDILHRRRHIGPHHAGEASEVLRQHRVALVRHRGRTLLALGEEFLGFQHLRALQVPDLRGEPLDR